MSYCRFSIDDSSDVYCFDHVAGYWQIYVAGSRRVHRDGIACPENAGLDDPEKFIEAHRAQMAWAESAELVPIGLPHDGASFAESGPAECADRLEALRAAGYHVPEHAIAELREEAREEP